MGTDATVAFQDSLPESGQWSFASWKRPVVTECSVPIADGDQNRELPFAGNAQNGKTDIRYAFS